ncbi:unannotated protein [freshwater metagenome]|uniref:Unannotated protein n=1 Tax=freshwater metagenome TaxID=449393 RepID=A0A6J7ATI8_9ZZZZ
MSRHQQVVVVARPTRSVPQSFDCCTAEPRRRQVPGDVTVAETVHERGRRRRREPHRVTARAFLLDPEVTAMQMGDVVPVDAVLELQLPVAAVAELVHAGGDLEPTAGRQVARDIHLGQHTRAEMFDERHDVDRQAREHEPAIRIASRHRTQPERVTVERVAVLLRMRNPDETAAVSKRPTVIRTGEKPAVAPLVWAHHCASMRATVHQHPNHAVVAAREDHRLAPELARPVVARFGYLAFVADEHPPVMEDPVDLLFEDLRIGVHRIVHAVVEHEVGVADGCTGGHDRLLRRARWAIVRATSSGAPTMFAHSSVMPAAAKRSRCASTWASDPTTARSTGCATPSIASCRA